MEKAIYPAILFLFIVFSCNDDTERLFHKTADERSAEAIAALKQDLVSPPNGWLIKYRPQEDAGAYYVLLDFEENNKVTIKSDLGASDGEYFESTITYRIDSSLGLELIFETYSFFSFLFEQDQAAFGAEFEFDYVNKTPDNALVFRSKSDTGSKDIVVFTQAGPGDESLLGTALGSGLNLIANDFDKFVSSLKLTYSNKDLALYLSLDELRRTVTFTSASLKTNIATTQSIDFTTSYIIEGNRLVLDDPFQGTVLGNAITIEHIQLGNVNQATLSVCTDPITIHAFTGVTSDGNNFTLETSLFDAAGKSFAQLSDFYVTPIGYIFDNGVSVGSDIANDITGAVSMQLYYNYDLGGGEVLNAIGFYLSNGDRPASFALREFTPVLNNNNLVFNFAPDITLFGNQNPDANIENINIYLDKLTSGGKTYVFQVSTGLYEFFNPCTGWTTIMINAND